MDEILLRFLYLYIRLETSLDFHPSFHIQESLILIYFNELAYVIQIKDLSFTFEHSSNNIDKNNIFIT